MDSLMKWTSCVGVRQVCTQVSVWLWWLAAVDYLVFFKMNKNINLKNLKHFTVGAIPIIISQNTEFSGSRPA